MAGPSSETFGRKAVYVCALPGVGAFTLGAGFSQNITSLIVCRFFAGLFASPGLSIGTAMLSDFLPPEKRGGPVAIFITTVQMGPILGPIIGGYVTETKNWRWTQWVILFGLAVALVVTAFMSETYKAVILKRRGKRLGVQPAPELKSSGLENVKFFVTKTITRPFYMMLTEPIVALFDIYNAFNFGLLNAFFAAFSWVFQNVYGFGIGATGLTYLGQAVGSVAGLMIVLYIYNFDWAKENKRIKEGDSNANMAPEKRLIIAQIGAPMFPISLFWFAWTARSDVHWISPVIAEGFFSCGNLLIFTCTGLYFTDCYGALYSASAWSSCTFIRYLAAFAFPLFVIQMYEGLGVGWATSLLGFVALALVPVPFALSKYGEQLRKRSKFSSGE
ncbi:hypothetical protein LTR37_002547 [Vermiconidia calcicola]|uniref:Uncharacterized protein n=1 Tax=Vermiconidia calcicola TaxID=1690605 RepID=A0ACC3NTS3_9PEZI|nr:hypothetical protein LTR37_002547 [Vermiconidia calcicola]